MGALNGPIEIDQVRIDHEGLWICADRGVWHTEEERAELHGNVSIRDSSRVVTAARGFYYRARSLLELEEDVRGRGSEGTFRCDRLTYDRKGGLLTLGGAVYLEEDGRRLRTHWLNYEIADSLMTAGGDVRLFETGDSVEVYGDRLFYDRREGRITVVSDGGRRPRLVRLASGGAAPFVIRADTLRLYTAGRIGDAFGEVQFTRGGVRGSCDRVLYRMAEDRLLLVGSPRVGDPDGLVFGDSMAVSLGSGRADKLVVWGRARTEYFPPGRPGEAHFSLGDSLSAFLEAGVIQSVLIEGGAQALYLPSDRDIEQGIGLNWTRSIRLRLTMRESRVHRVQFEGEVQGRYVLPIPPEESQKEPGLRTAPDLEKEPDLRTAPDLEKEPDLRTAPDLEKEPEPHRRPIASIRELAATGTLEPPDSLVRALGFNIPETVVYGGDRIDFHVATDRIVISGNGQVAYQGMELYSEEITFDSGRGLIIAKGDPILKDPSSEVHGTEMTYRIDNKKGLVFQGRSEFEGGYYRGERVKRVEEKALFVQDGDFTSCDADTPHFHFHAKKMKIITKEKVIARPVVLYIGNIPIMALPYAVFPIRSGRQSGLLIPQVEFGFDTERGRFLRNLGYYLAPNDYWDALFWMDYYEEDPRLTLNARGRYRVRYLLNGRMEGSFTKQDYESGRKKSRWLVKVNHDQVLGERFNLKVSGNFQSDKDYGGDRDFGASVDERINRVLRSQVSLSKSWSGASVSLAADRTEYLDDSGGSTRISQGAPALNFNLSSFPLGVKPGPRGKGGKLGFLSSMYARGDVRYRDIYKKTWDDEVTTNRAAGLNASISDKRRLMGGVNLTPSVRISAAWAHKDDEGKRDRTGLTWRMGLSASSTVYGTFFPNLGPWEGLRHAIELSASYGYSPEIKSVKGFPSVGGISLSSSKSSSVSLRLTQRFHVKVRAGEKTVKHQNLLVWSSSTSYDFLAEEKGRETPWADLSHTLRFKPGGFLGSELSLVHDVETWTRSRLTLRSTLSMRGGQGPDPGAGGRAPIVEGDGRAGIGGFGDPGTSEGSGPGREWTTGSLTGPWSLTATHVFSMGRDWESHRSSINLASEMSLTKGWRLRYSVYYDLSDREVTSQGYSLYRDLHCWRAVLERRTSGGRSSYYFRINVKDLTDLKYERRRG